MAKIVDMKFHKTPLYGRRTASRGGTDDVMELVPATLSAIAPESGFCKRDMAEESVSAYG